MLQIGHLPISLSPKSPCLLVSALSRVLQPLPFERPGERFELLGCRRFDQIRVGAKRVASAQIARFVGRRQHDDDQRFELFLTANPSKQLVALNNWQFEIEENDRGQRIAFAVGELAGAR